MSRIGKTTIGLTDFATIKHGNNTNRSNYHVGPYMASEDGVVDSMSLYTETTGVSLRLGVYLHDETTSQPTTLVAQSSTTTISTGGWQTLARTSETGVIEKGKRYWLSFMTQSTWVDGGVNGEITCKLDNTEELMWRFNGTSNPTFVLPNPQTGSQGSSTQIRAISAYFTYTPTLPPAEDTSLQARINRASPNDTIRIRAGFYNEHLRINKPLKLVGVPDRRGRLPIIQGGTLIDIWTQSTAPEHTGKNVWYKDIRIGQSGTDVAAFVRSLQLDEKSVVVVQGNPALSPDGSSEVDATAVRTHVLTCEFESPGYFLVSGETIDFWQWYDAIACHDTTGRLWLRLKNNVNPNNSVCYVTATQNVRDTNPASNTDLWLSNETASVIKCENQPSVTIRNLEIRGGRYGIVAHNSSNVVIEKCKIVAAGDRSIDIANCSTVTIQRNEMTYNPMQTNLGTGIGGTSARANAMKFGRSLPKNYSDQAVSIYLSGVTSSVTIRRNWMHKIGVGVEWSEGNDLHLIDAVIENNLFEKMSSTGIVIRPRSTGSARYNIFYEVQLNIRVQSMMQSPEFSALDNLATIENNFFRSLENAGYVLQAHYSGTHATYNWTSPIVFNNNVVQNVSILIANLKGFADVEMNNNVIDVASPIPTAVITHGMESFTNNWVGGNASTAPSQSWWGAGNDYQASPATRRLVGSELPVGWEQVGTYRQNVGLPIRRRANTTSARVNTTRTTNPDLDLP